MAYNDSIQKIKSYIESIQKDEIVLSAKFFRDYTCPSHCGGCCPKFSLDYFEGERWEIFKSTYPHLIHKFEKREINGVAVYTNFQKENKTTKCEFLNLEDGRCGIHISNPFSCEFELNKFVVKKDKTFLINKLYGRGWNMMRIDGLRGALCEMKPFSLEKFKRDVKLLEELKNICDLLGEKVPLLEKIINFLKDRKTPINSNLSFKSKT